MATKTLNFPTTTRTTRTPASLPAAVVPIGRPSQLVTLRPDAAPQKIGRLMLAAEVLFIAAATLEANADLSIVEAVEIAESIIADPSTEQTPYPDLAAMVAALFPGLSATADEPVLN